MSVLIIYCLKLYVTVLSGMEMFCVCINVIIIETVRIALIYNITLPHNA